MTNMVKSLWTTAVKILGAGETSLNFVLSLAEPQVLNSVDVGMGHNHSN